jgi:hypothetical protein
MSNIHTGEIVASKIDVSIINQGIKNRADALSGEMNPEAAAQFLKDMSARVCTVEGEGSSVKFAVQPSESYMIEYLKNHDIPVAGGDNGTAHNTDGSTYTSSVPQKFWGTELPWLELPHLDGEEEAIHIVELLAPDATRNGISSSSAEIGKAAKTLVAAEIQNYLGGGSL